MPRPLAAVLPGLFGLFAQLHSLRAPLTPWQSAQIEARPRLCARLDRVDAATWRDAGRAGSAGRRPRSAADRLVR